jgi:hypothetical protein
VAANPAYVDNNAGEIGEGPDDYVEVFQNQEGGGEEEEEEGERYYDSIKQHDIDNYVDMVEEFLPQRSSNGVGDMSGWSRDERGGRDETKPDQAGRETTPEYTNHVEGFVAASKLSSTLGAGKSSQASLLHYVNDMDEISREVSKANASSEEGAYIKMEPTSRNPAAREGSEVNLLKNEDPLSDRDEDDEGYMVYDPKHHDYQNRIESDIYTNTSTIVQASLEKENAFHKISGSIEKQSGFVNSSSEQSESTSPHWGDSRPYVNDFNEFTAVVKLKASEEDDSRPYVNDLDELVAAAKLTEGKEGGDTKTKASRRNPYVNDVMQLLKDALGDDQGEIEKNLEGGGGDGGGGDGGREEEGRSYVNDLAGLLASARD